MSTLLEMATNIVSAHASSTPMTKSELLSEIQEVYKALASMEQGIAITTEAAVEEGEGIPLITKRKAFGKDKITCMICGKIMKTLGRHLKAEHGMTGKEYRKQFDIPRTQPLAAKSYSESRRQMALEKNLGAGLAKARAVKSAAKQEVAKKPGKKKG